MNERRRAVGALAAAVVATSGIAMFSASPSSASGHRGPGCRCFHVTGSGPDVPQSRFGAITRDRNGGQHIIAARRVDGTSQNYYLSYLTRQPGQHRWTHKRIPNTPLLSGNGGLGFLALQATTGNQVVAVVTTRGSKVFVGETSLKSDTMTMTRVYQLTDNDYAVDDQGVACLPHHQVALLTKQSGTYPAVTIGAIGSTLPAPTLLPNPSNEYVQFAEIVEVPRTGELVVVGSTANDGAFAWTKQPNDAWSDPVQIAPASANFRVTSVNASAGKVSVGLITTMLHGPHPAVVERHTDGNWSTPATLPHTTDHDDSLIVAYSGSTGSLHVAFNHDTSHRGGIYHEVRVGKKWGAPQRITTSFRDEPAQITLNKHGHPIIGYQHT